MFQALRKHLMSNAFRGFFQVFNNASSMLPFDTTTQFTHSLTHSPTHSLTHLVPAIKINRWLILIFSPGFWIQPVGVYRPETPWRRHQDSGSPGRPFPALPSASCWNLSSYASTSARPLQHFHRGTERPSNVVVVVVVVVVVGRTDSIVVVAVVVDGDGVVEGERRDGRRGDSEDGRNGVERLVLVIIQKTGLIIIIIIIIIIIM